MFIANEGRIRFPFRVYAGMHKRDLLQIETYSRIFTFFLAPSFGQIFLTSHNSQSD